MLSVPYRTTTIDDTNVDIDPTVVDNLKLKSYKIARVAAQLINPVDYPPPVHLEMEMLDFAALVELMAYPRSDLRQEATTNICVINECQTMANVHQAQYLDTAVRKIMALKCLCGDVTPEKIAETFFYCWEEKDTLSFEALISYVRTCSINFQDYVIESVKNAFPGYYHQCAIIRYCILDYVDPENRFLHKYEPTACPLGDDCSGRRHYPNAIVCQKCNDTVCRYCGDEIAVQKQDEHDRFDIEDTNENEQLHYTNFISFQRSSVNQHDPDVATECTICSDCSKTKRFCLCDLFVIDGQLWDSFIYGQSSNQECAIRFMYRDRDLYNETDFVRRRSNATTDD